MAKVIGNNPACLLVKEVFKPLFEVEGFNYKDSSHDDGIWIKYGSRRVMEFYYVRSRMQYTMYCYDDFYEELTDILGSERVKRVYHSDYGMKNECFIDEPWIRSHADLITTLLIEKYTMGSEKTNDINTPQSPESITKEKGLIYYHCPRCGYKFIKAPRCTECGQAIKQ